MGLILHGLTPAFWNQFQAWHVARKANCPAGAPNHSIFVVDTVSGQPVAGVLLYPTDGPYFLVEHLSTNPWAPLRMRHDAVVALAKGVRVYGTIINKWALVAPRYRSTVAILRRAGFMHSDAVLLVAKPVMEDRGSGS